MHHPQRIAVPYLDVLLSAATLAHRTQMDLHHHSQLLETLARIRVHQLARVQYFGHSFMIFRPIKLPVITTQD